jgi:hypothetical protein
MTKSEERRRQREIGFALLVGAAVLAVLLGLIVYRGLP